MTTRFASATVLALMALVVVAVTVFLYTSMPPEPASAGEVIEDYYIPADDEPPAVDAMIEEQRFA